MPMIPRHEVGLPARRHWVPSVPGSWSNRRLAVSALKNLRTTERRVEPGSEPPTFRLLGCATRRRARRAVESRACPGRPSRAYVLHAARPPVGLHPARPLRLRRAQHAAPRGRQQAEVVGLSADAQQALHVVACRACSRPPLVNRQLDPRPSVVAAIQPLPLHARPAIVRGRALLDRSAPDRVIGQVAELQETQREAWPSLARA
mmetsp:Transcript_25165/g.75604  ORF Transcript_25165/g.75604 Transcript_25165/m.75604 type:complete len:204 (-) Transcript_25165:364-975(-)